MLSAMRLPPSLSTARPPIVAALATAVLAFAPACVYPVRATSVVPLPAGVRAVPPADLVRVQLVSAEIPPRQRSGLVWDDDGSPPDAILKIYRGSELLWESPRVDDSLRPEWTNVVTDNLLLDREETLRIELWDEDDAFDQPIGTWTGRGLPRSAIPGAPWRILLEGRAALVLRPLDPIGRRGTGVPRFEERGDSLFLVEVLRFSPAGRAGLMAGDRIVALDGEPVARLGMARAATMLSQAWNAGTRVTVERDGRRDDVTFDREPIWPAR